MTATVQRLARPQDRRPESAHFGRDAPRVGGVPATPVRFSRLEGLSDGVPFFFFGAACLALGLWASAANPDPGNPLQLWVLLDMVGALALGGALVGALLPPDPEPETARPDVEGRRPGRNGRDWPRGGPNANRTAVPDLPVGRGAMAEPEPMPEGYPFQRRGPDPAYDGRAGIPEAEPVASRLCDLSAENRFRPLFGTGVPWTQPRDLTMAAFHSGPKAETATETEDVGAPEDILRSLDEISEKMRREPVSSPAGKGKRGVRRPNCAGCDAPVPPDEAVHQCTTCSRPICPACSAESTDVGRTSLCPTCAVLLDGWEPLSPAPSGRRIRYAAPDPSAP